MADETPRLAQSRHLGHANTQTCDVCGTPATVIGPGVFRSGSRRAAHWPDGERCPGSYSRVQNAADLGGAP